MRSKSVRARGKLEPLINVDTVVEMRRDVDRSRFYSWLVAKKQDRSCSKSGAKQNRRSRDKSLSFELLYLMERGESQGENASRWEYWVAPGQVVNSLGAQGVARALEDEE